MLVVKVLEGMKPLDSVPGDVKEYPSLRDDEGEPEVVLLGPDGSKLLVGYSEPLGDGPPDETLEVEYDFEDDDKLPPLPVTGEVDETPLRPLVVGRPDGPTMLLLGSSVGYDDEPFVDDCSVPGVP